MDFAAQIPDRFRANASVFEPKAQVAPGRVPAMIFLFLVHSLAATAAGCWLWIAGSSVLLGPIVYPAVGRIFATGEDGRAPAALCRRPATVGLALVPP